MGVQHIRSRPHTVPSRFSKRRDDDFIESNEDRDRDRDRDRDDEESSYHSDRGDDSYADRGHLRENGMGNGTRNSGMRKRNNDKSTSAGSATAHRKQGGFEDRDRDSAEDTLAMQTMSLIHGQLTAMKHQLLTISDISKAPESEDTSQSFNQGQGPPPPSQNSFFRSKTLALPHLPATCFVLLSPVSFLPPLSNSYFLGELILFTFCLFYQS